MHAPYLIRRRADRKAGLYIPPEEDPVYALSGRAYRLSGRVWAFDAEHVQPILEALLANGLTWEDFGLTMMYERIAAGDRSDIANPYGLTYEGAMEQQLALMKKKTPEQRMLLRRTVDRFRAAVKAVARERTTKGSIPARSGRRSTRTRPTGRATRSSTSTTRSTRGFTVSSAR